ncbi:MULTISPECIES: deoxyuridine 5'-triphosphate nucleotidohydrolase [Halobacterium]|uniref:Probable deoxyuridine 5'-triphosphate nucleotidohydrolase n=5 Tax=Halobacterium salinarum TaxID=2242 RepID=DUT_HALSA|nr:MULTISPECIES: deoxyuridine 5'-triphosphate nucleotidohydrolase [Halobacterium]B0R858.1 RecName: Full=Probable deoxyuridine 5'-triphosphate nucleotidohydrolase; Short=dUTPase; AltName: Full=dUTP pyrophosphatase [Halobacterium salinarum R1]Q9HMF3.1 RecName: Full=Probable deoxyuridine 5'-triphosphate nucleotidohydrolase; Short=dUTPase; AltName: Full=dUTP pyrophosphatase [Halobacterium salinarum NRC-1]AAG20618.1 deoxycytidine triphosphate deaminase [Halobacterium salinarum NRC-1]MBB6089447.1 dUT
MYERGAFVADHVEPVADDQIQPNGVDLTVDAVLEQTEPGRIDTDGKTIGDRSPVTPTADEDSTDTTVTIQPGTYILQYAETITIPENHVGFVYPRSSLMRNSCMLHSAVWDAGYTGRGEGLFEVHHEITIARGARVAQLVLATGDHENTYDGSYQHERTDTRPGE